MVSDLNQGFFQFFSLCLPRKLRNHKKILHSQTALHIKAACYILALTDFF